jgi:divalent metal cation (Fe/Co/Zn/Cd) transporter
MAEFDFTREVRTPYSECYTILEGDSVVGRIDIHYADAVVHATLTVAESLTNVAIQEIIDRVSEEVLDALGIVRQDVIVHVHQGRDMGVFSTPEFGGNGGGPPHID